MMKNKIIKGIYLIVLLITLFLFGCSNEVEIPKSLSLFADETTVRVGEELELFASTTIQGDLIWMVDDESIATVDENGYLTGLKEGEVIVTVLSKEYPEYTSSLNVQVLEGVITNVKMVGVNYGFIGDTLTFKYQLEPKEVKSDYTVISKNEDIAIVNKDNSITLKKNGIAQIVVSIQDSGELVKTFNIGCFTFKKILVDASFSKKEEGEKINVEGEDYFYGFTAFSSINKAASMLTEGSELRIEAGIYDEDFTIKANDVLVYGVDEPFIEGTTVITAQMHNITIEGLHYRNDAGILLYGGHSNILIQKCDFENNTSDQPWKEIINKGVIQFYPSKYMKNDNICITDNDFYNLNDPAINLSYVNNLKITNNEFTECRTDCIRFSDQECSSSCQWLIKDNIFGSCYNGIYSRVLGSSILSYDVVFSIFDNMFKYMTNYAIQLEGYNNGTICMDVRYNGFFDNAKNIYIDTNDTKNKEARFFPYIENNNFVCSNLNYLIKTSVDENSTEDSMNQVQFNFNYVGTETKAYSLKEVQAVASKNVLISEVNVFMDEYSDVNKIYGKSVLFLDEETSYICAEATQFYSSDPTVLTIDNNGKVTPLKEGTTQIMAYGEWAVLGTFEVTIKGQLQIDYATRLLQVAYEQEGYVEGNNNYTKYGVWYSEQVNDGSFAYGAWCAMFVSWCADQAGISRTIIPLYAACTTGRDWFESRGLFQYKENYKPKAGDIIFFLSAGAGHTGIVISCDGNTVYTIEGNTSNMCAKRSYSWNYKTITGYGTPAYPPYTGKSTVTFDVSNATEGAGQSTR